MQLLFKVNDNTLCYDLSTLEFKASENSIDNHIEIVETGTINSEPFVAKRTKFRTISQKKEELVIFLPVCGSKCWYCSNKDKLYSSYDYDAIISDLEQISMEEYSILTITGGEPLESLDLLEYIFKNIGTKVDKINLYTTLYPAYKDINIHHNLVIWLNRYNLQDKVNIITTFADSNYHSFSFDKLKFLASFKDYKLTIRHSLSSKNFINEYKMIHEKLPFSFNYSVLSLLESVVNKFSTEDINYLMTNIKNNYDVIAKEGLQTRYDVSYVNVNLSDRVYELLLGKTLTTNISSYIYIDSSSAKKGKINFVCNDCMDYYTRSCLEKCQYNKVIPKCSSCPILYTCCIVNSSVKHYTFSLCDSVKYGEIVTYYLNLKNRKEICRLF